jgi:hypothetical protein
MIACLCGGIVETVMLFCVSAGCYVVAKITEFYNRTR